MSPFYRLGKLERSYIFTTPPGLTLGCPNLQRPSLTSCSRCGSLGASTLTRGLWWCTAAQASDAREPSVLSTLASYWSVLHWESHSKCQTLFLPQAEIVQMCYWVVQTLISNGFMKNHDFMSSNCQLTQWNLLWNICLQMSMRKDPSSVHIRDVLLEMRRYRMGLIQTPDQLRFSYLAVIEGARCIMGDASLQVSWIQLLVAAMNQSAIVGLARTYKLGLGYL